MPAPRSRRRRPLHAAMSPPFAPLAGLCPALLLLLLLGAALWTPPAQAYIPAMPTNSSDTVLDTSNSSLSLAWFGGGFSEPVSYQLVGADSVGVNKVRRTSARVGGIC